MARKQYWNTEAKNTRWIKEGRGQTTDLGLQFAMYLRKVVHIAYLAMRHNVRTIYYPILNLLHFFYFNGAQPLLIFENNSP